jgi:hypothetical protein
MTVAMVAILASEAAAGTVFDNFDVTVHAPRHPG